MSNEQIVLFLSTGIMLLSLAILAFDIVYKHVLVKCIAYGYVAVIVVGWLLMTLGYLYRHGMI